MPDSPPACPTIPALSLHQPYASFMAGGWKTAETRSWSTGYTGWVALHAASTIPSYLGLGRRGTLRIGDYEIEKDGPGQLLLRGGGLAWPYRMRLGAIVAIGRLDRCVPTSDVLFGDTPGWRVDVERSGVDHVEQVYLNRAERPYGDFASGRYAWMFSRIRRVSRAIPCGGHQQLWDVSRAGPDVTAQVMQLVVEAGCC